MAGMDLGYLAIPIKIKRIQNKILPLITGKFYLLHKQNVGENDFCVGSLHFNKNEMVSKLSLCTLGQEKMASSCAGEV